MSQIRRRSRKIGRNEPCPCGRTKQQTAVKAHTVFNSAGVPLTSHSKFETTVFVKYKHCCGHITNQRMMAAVQRYIGQTIYNVVHGPKQVSKLRKLINLFKKDKK